MSRRDLVELLDDLDEGQEEGTHAARVHTRWPFRAMSLPVTFVHPGGSEVEVRLACRNLSGGGVGLLHNSYIHQGTECVVFLPKLTGGVDRVRGEVRRCVHREGLIHEVGVKFRSQIDVRKYFEVDPLSGWFANENVDPDSLAGNVLHLEPHLRDRQAVREALRDSRVRVQAAETVDEALEQVTDEISAAIIDVDLQDIDPIEFLRTLRERCPIGVLLTCAAPASRARGVAAFPTVVGVVTKPCEKRKVLSGVEAALSFDPAKAADRVDVDDEMVSGFCGELGRLADVIAKAARKNDAMAVYAACSEIRGNATPLGFVGLGQLTATINNELARNMDIASVRDELARLIASCRDFAQRAA